MLKLYVPLSVCFVFPVFDTSDSSLNSAANSSNPKNKKIQTNIACIFIFHLSAIHLIICFILSFVDFVAKTLKESLVNLKPDKIVSQCVWVEIIQEKNPSVCDSRSLSLHNLSTHIPSSLFVSRSSISGSTSTPYRSFLLSFVLESFVFSLLLSLLFSFFSVECCLFVCFSFLSMTDGASLWLSLTFVSTFSNSFDFCWSAIFQKIH